MDSKGEQFYPTYTFKPENRDIVLLEFEEAQKIANSQTKVYGQVANVLIAVVTTCASARTFRHKACALNDA